MDSSSRNVATESSVVMPSGNLTCSAGATEITGTAFDDINFNGIYDTGEVLGVGDITVTATDAANNTISTTIDSTGNYTLSGLIAGTNYRVEFIFTATSDWAKSSIYNGDNGTTVQFLQPGNCANIAVASAADYCQSNPYTALACYENGDGSSNNNSGFVRFSYNDQGVPAQYGGPASNPSSIATVAQIGTVWGTTYDKEGEIIYSTAFLKRHTSLGPLGLSGIYMINPNAGTYIGSFDLEGVVPDNGGSALNFGTINRTTVAGAISGGAAGDFQLSQIPTVATVDLDAFVKIGKVGMGDAEISEDGSKLWTLNLNDSEIALVSIDLKDPTNTVPTNGSAVPSAIVNRYLMGDMSAPSCPGGDFRPFGLAFYRGRGFVGGVCSAEESGNTSQLSAYVLSFDPDNPLAGFTAELNFPLDSPRENKTQFGHAEDSDWRPWADQWSDLTISSNRYVDFASPMLSDIEFTRSGDMVLGMMDRYGHQGGFQMYPAESGASGGALFDVETGGDIYHACKVGDNWFIEGDLGGGCPTNDQGSGISSNMLNDGPYGAGEFYWGDFWITWGQSGHGELAHGGVSILKTTDEVYSIAFDPNDQSFNLSNANTQGVIKLSTNTGERLGHYMIVDNNGTDLGKSGGLGEPILVCDPAPIEIGSYVWEDIDADGIQDAGEPGIADVRMELYSSTGNLLASITTDATGQYFFSADGVDAATWQTGGDKLSTYTDYYVIAGGNGQFASDVMNISGTDYYLTGYNTDAGANRYAIDNDGQVAVGVDSDFDGEPYLNVATTHSGSSDHSLDFGFSTTPPVSCSVNIASTTAENCSEISANNFTADWEIDFEITDAPDSDVSYQRNSEAIQSHTLVGTTGVLTIPGIPADGGTYDTLKVWFTNDIICGDTVILKRPLPCPPDLGSNPGEICNTVATTDISGSVWEDWNYDAIINEATINGVLGVEVSIYDCDDNQEATTYTDASGNYQFTGLTAGENYRVEFKIPEVVSCWAKPTQAGTNNGTTVQFVQPGNCASLGLASPADFCQDDPLLMIPCYVRGGGSGTEDVVVRWSYSNSGLLPGDKIKVSEDAQVGALWGMAYDRDQKLTYASAILKSHTSLHEGAGGGGLDAIFSIDPFSPTNGTVWLELEDDLGINVGQSLVPNNATRGLGSAVQYDEVVYPLIGTVGIGDIDISPDNKTLYVMNLFDRTLYAIDVATKTTVETYPIPDPGCTNGTYRPWAIEFHDGKVFVGSICDASTAGKDATASDALTNTTGRSDLHAYIYRLDETGFTEVLDFSLDYNKQPPHGTWGNHALVEGWFPWTDDLPLAATGFTSAGIFRNFHSYPTPILSDIVFDDDGSMILAFADRTAFQLGDENYGPNTSDLGYHTVFSGGDLLRACKSGTDWVIEGTANSCTNSGGHAMDNQTGNYVSGFQVYDDTPTTFGKGAGLGDLIALCNAAPIEIGNYVWEDSDEDGIQDACESGIDGVTVELLKSSTVIATTQTTNGGQYYFSSATSADPNLSWTATGVDTSLIANTSYTIRISNAEGGSQQVPLTGLILTQEDVNSNNDNNIDNDAILNGSHAEVAVTTGDYGCMDHSLDFGFFLDCPSIASITPDLSICTGALVDSLTVTTNLENPDSIAFVYFSTMQTDSYAIYSGGTGIDTTQIASGTDTIRLRDVSGFTNSGTTPDTFFVYAILRPTPSNVTCRPYEEIVVIVNPYPAISDLTDQSICAGESFNLTNVTTSETTGVDVTYQWHNNNGTTNTGTAAISGQTNATLTPVPNAVGSYSYRVVASNSENNACSDEKTVNLTVNPNPVLSNLSDQSICEGENFTLANVTTSETAGVGVTYQWYNNNGTDNTGTDAISGQNTAALTVLPTTVGSYIYRVLATNTANNSCTDEKIVTLTIHPNPVLSDLIDQSICLGESFTAANVTTSETAGVGVTYQWYNNNGTDNTGTAAISGQTTATLTTLPTTAGSYNFRVVATTSSLNGSCTDEKTVTLVINIQPVLSDLIDQSICEGESFTVANVTTSETAGAGVTYQWYNNNGTDNTGTAAISGQTTATLTALPTATGSYSYRVVATNSANSSCTDEKMVTLNIYANPTATATVTHPTCSGPFPNDNGTITISDFTTETFDLVIGNSYTGSATYATATAIPTGGVITNTLTNPTGSQEYTIRVFNVNGCFIDQSVSLNEVICPTYDWGDLADLSAGIGVGDYQTSEANNGPSHFIVSGLHLGASIDFEVDGQQSFNALGDGADEDGISFPASMQLVQGGTLNIPISATNTTGSTSHLEMWIDWNGDGDFDDANEMIADLDDGASSFPSSINLAIPTNTVLNQNLGVRVRLSNEDNMTPYGLVNSGEVEDYVIMVSCKENCLIITVGSD